MGKVVEGEFSDTAWDKKKIILAVLLVFLLVGGVYIAKKNFLDKNKVGVEGANHIVLGTAESSEKSSGLETLNSQNSSKSAPVSLQTELIRKLETIKKEVTQLSPSDIAGSSLQIQKVLGDMKALEEYPKNQAKEMCEQVCSKL